MDQRERAIGYEMLGTRWVVGLISIISMLLAGAPTALGLPAEACNTIAGTDAAPSRLVSGTYDENCKSGGSEHVISSDSVGGNGFCAAAGDLDAGELGACPDGAHMVADLPALARSLVVRLALPPATPVFGPDPNNNEWKMLAVGFPVWLWTDGPREKSATASAQGLTFRLRASLRSTTFAMGDGKQLTCTAMTTYTSSVKPGSKSPTCGYVYTQPSPPKGAYTVTATANWQISWSVDGFSGSFPYSYSDSASIRIGELSALNR